MRYCIEEKMNKGGGTGVGKSRWHFLGRVLS